MRGIDTAKVNVHTGDGDADRPVPAARISRRRSPMFTCARRAVLAGALAAAGGAAWGVRTGSTGQRWNGDLRKILTSHRFLGLSNIYDKKAI